MGSKKSSPGLPVIPRSYSIFIKPNCTDSTFDGSVVIHLDIIKETKLMIMSGKNLKIKKVNLRVSSAVIKSPAVTVLEEKELIFLEFGTLLKYGWAVLSIHYGGLINNTMLGLFKTNIENGSMATCRKPLLARNLFPCWDNPSLKSTFEISLCGTYRAALSNMPVESKEDNDDSPVVKFQPTLPMSVDQVSMVFGNYGFIESHYKNAIIRVYTEPYKMELGRYTLDCLVKLVQNLSVFIDIPYPLTKLDAVILDEITFDFMESWGLLMLPSRHALIKSHQSLISKKTLLKILSQCVTRQWIGNLVTVNKVDEHWFLKGIANYIGVKICNILQPELNPLLWFFLDTKEDVLTCYTRINILKNPDLTYTQDDENSFQIKKTSSVVSMVENYMGEDKFKQGVQFFIQKYKYSGISPEHLWSSLEVYSKIRLIDTMHKWLYEENYPLIVVKNVNHDGIDKVIEISQEPFHKNLTETGSDSCWEIPVTFVRSKQPNKAFFQTIVSQREMRIRLPNVGKNGWVKLNSKSFGFYRVLYPKVVLQEFIKDFLLKTMHVDDRIGIISDLRALVLSGREKTSTLLSFISQLGDEDSAVWWIIIKFFEDLFIIVPHTKAEQGFREYGLTVFKKIYNNLGWYSKKKENPLDTLLRPLVLKLYCRFGDSDAVIESKKRFLGLVLKNEEIEDDLLVPVFYGCARIGGDKEYNQLIDLYKNSCLESERDKIIEGICGFYNDEYIKKLIDFLMADEQKTYSFVRYLEHILNEFGTKVVWECLKTNWEKLEEKFSTNVNVLSNLVTSLIYHWPCTEKDEDILDFGLKIGQKLPFAVEEGLGKLKLYKNWHNRDLSNIERFFTPWATSVTS